MTIAAANMANAIREVTLKQGVDPRDAALFAFGGAGPLFWTQLAAELDMERDRSCRPRRQLLGLGPAGAGHRPGRRRATFVHAARRRRHGAAPRRCSTASPTACARSPTPDGARASSSAHAADLRFVGQEYALTTTAPAPRHVRAAATWTRCARPSSRDYRRTLRPRARRPAGVRPLRATAAGRAARRGDAAARRRRRRRAGGAPEAYSFTARARVPFAVVDAPGLGPRRHASRGPAIVLEPTATTYVDAGYAIARERTAR